jgi:hypothetical protein
MNSARQGLDCAVTHLGNRKSVAQAVRAWRDFKDLMSCVLTEWSLGQPKRSRDASGQRGWTRCGCLREHPRAIAELGAGARSRLSPPSIRLSSASRLALALFLPAIPSNFFPSLVPVAESRVHASPRPAPPAVRERILARYAGFADDHGSSPGGDLARDADALHPPPLASPYASRRAATITLARVIYEAAWVYLPSRALTRPALERRG